MTVGQKCIVENQFLRLITVGLAQPCSVYHPYDYHADFGSSSQKCDIPNLLGSLSFRKSM